jgi:hypothetical protein
MSEGKGQVGSSFDDFLKDKGLYEEVTAAATKRVLNRRITGPMQARPHLQDQVGSCD